MLMAMATFNALVAVVAGAIFVYALYNFLTPRKDAREPPYVWPSIPSVGHILGMAFQGSDYFLKLDKQHHQPIYTLPMLSGRMYMICDPAWVSAVLKAHKTVSFRHLVVQGMQHMFEFDQPALELISHNKDSEDGTRSGLLPENHDMMRAALATGPDMDATTLAVLHEEASRVNRLAKEGATHEVQLWSWVHEHFSMSSINALYGPDNPYQLHKGLLDDFHKFETASTLFMLLPWPSVLITRAYKARQRLLDVWAEWVKEERFKKSSALIQKRADFHLNRFGLSKEMYGHGEASMNFGALSNTIPSGFWVLSYIFADAELLREIRKEVDNCVSKVESNKRVISLTNLKTRCPLFISAFQETLRIVASFGNGRFVIKDTLVTNSHTGESYLLKKDSMVQLATNVIHSQASIWGEDVDSFNPRRFLPSYPGPDARPADPAGPFKDDNGNIFTGAFRSFGSGNSMCLGRRFAQSQIMALAAIFVAGFEIVDRGQEHGYTLPDLPGYKRPMGAALHPVQDPKVDIRRRRGLEKVEWAFEL